ncbi:MAG: hypothetical protein K5686_04250 [Lachnospiraceae bacterium]|nr:hypothetical protein [Lachnospiraceae bacterium]
MKSSMVLIKNLLLSTSQWNIYRFCRDKKKRGRIIGNFIGQFILYLMLMAYCVFSCIGYGKLGLTVVIPTLCALTIALMAFFLTLFKTNGYLFNFKEYDMLMSLPFEAGTVAGCKFLYMYIKSLPWNLSISLAMLIGYAVYARPSAAGIFLWLLLSFFLPVIPMLAAAFIGYIIAGISAGFKKNNLIQTLLTFMIVIACFSLRFIIESVARTGRIEETLTDLSGFISQAGRTYPPAGWFVNAVMYLKPADILLMTGVTLLLFELVFIPVGRAYRRINSGLKSHAAAGKFSMTAQKRRSIYNAVAFKEFKRMTGSTVYMTNAAIGEMMALLLGIVILFVDVDKAVSTLTQGAPVTAEMLQVAIPLIVYFCIGMVATTAITPSLEGKNYWIVQSLPIPKKVLYQGKMLFNMYLTVPFSLFATICICIAARTTLMTAVLSVLLSFCLCAFSTSWGCVCGIRHMRLDWENEIEVVKQGAAVSLYILPNLFVTTGLIVLTVMLGTKVDRNVILAVLTLLVFVLTVLCYRRVCVIAEKQA